MDVWLRAWVWPDGNYFATVADESVGEEWIVFIVLKQSGDICRSLSLRFFSFRRGGCVDSFEQRQ
jgi:hypothetical protein